MAGFAVSLRVTGRVQGVWYRAWTKERAAALGLTGWVRNCSDGAVEGVIAGPEDKVMEMIAALRQGPPAARVAAVDWARTEGFDGEGFEIRP